jgi:hypothetical protein
MLQLLELRANHLLFLTLAGCSFAVSALSFAVVGQHYADDVQHDKSIG